MTLTRRKDIGEQTRHKDVGEQPDDDYLQHLVNSLTMTIATNLPTIAQPLETYTLQLQRCKDVGQVRLLHERIVEQGLETSLFLSNHLINMYSRCGSLQTAELLFGKLVTKNVHSWTVMITGFIHHGAFHRALSCLHNMQLEGILPNAVTLTTVFKACTSLEVGRKIHETIAGCEMVGDLILGSALINMYDRCGSLEDAVQVFETVSVKNVVTWTSMISAYVQHGQAKRALHLFRRMHLESLSCNVVTHSCVVKACGELRDIAEGRRIHSQIIETGWELDIVLGTALIDMYGKCRWVHEARLVFERLRCTGDLVCWNCMVAVYADNQLGDEAFKLFRMMNLEGVIADKITFLTLLGVCDSKESLSQGKLLHSFIVEKGLQVDEALGTAILTMYGHCGCVEESVEVFETLDSVGDPVTWSSMASVYVHNQLSKDCLHLFWRMQQEGMQADRMSFAAALNSCALLTDVKAGRKVHSCAMEEELELDMTVTTALMNMYGKCGMTDTAHELFHRLSPGDRDAVCWHCLLGVYAESGETSQCLESFRFMQQEGVEPLDVTFVKALAACSRGGVVDEAKWLFKAMRRDFGISPREEHLICLVDILGRAGELSEAAEVVRKYTRFHTGSDVLWTSLLSSCGIHSESKQGKDSAHDIPS